jgi:hypothetical protein
MAAKLKEEARPLTIDEALDFIDGCLAQPVATLIRSPEHRPFVQIPKNSPDG